MRRNYVEQKKICDAWKESSLNQTDFCRQNNVCHKALNRWLIKFNDKQAGENNLVATKRVIKLLPVGKISSEQSSLEVLLPNGVGCKVSLSEAKMESFLWRIIQCK